ncbi:hypothetical protein Mapa_011970 [Marchantia paleacea]|nr:hypothetical protein Mapa_011970 [Marchantia paleacea]
MVRASEASKGRHKKAGGPESYSHTLTQKRAMSINVRLLTTTGAVKSRDSTLLAAIGKLKAHLSLSLSLSLCAEPILLSRLLLYRQTVSLTYSLSLFSTTTLSLSRLFTALN